MANLNCQLLILSFVLMIIFSLRIAAQISSLPMCEQNDTTAACVISHLNQYVPLYRQEETCNADNNQIAEISRKIDNNNDEINLKLDDLNNDEINTKLDTVIRLLQSVDQPEPLPSTSTPINMPCRNLTQPPQNCQDVKDMGYTQSGVYSIFIPDLTNFQPHDYRVSISVYCDMVTDGGGWMMIQRRQDGSVEFNQTWNKYAYGFGDLSGEHWLGNEYLYRLTNLQTYELRIELGNHNGDWRYAVYNSFVIESELYDYRLTLGEHSGTLNDSLSVYSQNQVFSTKDGGRYSPCVQKHNDAGFWYNRNADPWSYYENECSGAYLNGKYRPCCSVESGQGISWRDWNGHTYSFKNVQMKIKPVNQVL